MARAYGIGARHFFIREVPYRKGWYELLEQGKGNNFCLVCRSRAKLYIVREILNEIWSESKNEKNAL